MLHRYGNLSCIESLDPDEAIELLNHALMKSEEDRAFLIYANKYPYFTKDDFMPFSQFFQVQTQTISQRSTEDILKDVYEIRKRRAQKEG